MRIIHYAGVVFLTVTAALYCVALFSYFHLTLETLKNAPLFGATLFVPALGLLVCAIGVWADARVINDFDRRVAERVRNGR